MNNIWIAEESYDGSEWYPLVDFVETRKKRLVKKLKDVVDMNTDIKAKYRVVKYRRVD